MKRSPLIAFGAILLLLIVGGSFLFFQEPSGEVVPIETPTPELISASPTPTTTQADRKSVV